MKENAPLSGALCHARAKALAAQACLPELRRLDAAAAAAMTVILGDTLLHIGRLETALSRCGIFPALTGGGRGRRACDKSARAQLDALIREEQLALTRQSPSLARCRREDRMLLADITREQAVHLRMMRTLTERL